MNPFAQDGFAARFDWGAAGLQTLASAVDVVVIVDVLSFSTAVEVATSRGAGVFPYEVRDESATEFAAQQGAVLASARRAEPPSLSPRTLTSLPKGARLVLPSPNGSTLTTLASSDHATVAGCLRNAHAIAEWGQARGTVGVVAAGELRRDGSMRVALEDLVGAGAILSHFPRQTLSPEARAAVSVFEAMRHDLLHHLAECASGRELVGWGFMDDVAMAAELDCSQTVPLFVQPGLYAAAAA